MYAAEEEMERQRKEKVNTRKKNHVILFLHFLF